MNVHAHMVLSVQLVTKQSTYMHNLGCACTHGIKRATSDQAEYVHA